jgi:hypothetical protein
MYGVMRSVCIVPSNKSEQFPTFASQTNKKVGEIKFFRAAWCKHVQMFSSTLQRQGAAAQSLDVYLEGCSLKLGRVIVYLDRGFSRFSSVSCSECRGSDFKYATTTSFPFLPIHSSRYHPLISFDAKDVMQ